eukprot:gnl/Trimastix_PCT/4665.p1 GENE.gnl/Trimastix_PCT/4665~~gnl/Trimastix_PCT/4665.p1  ORF type:complete len:331 (+),score=15.05 gnl/Trimastix_PCT/4665:95-994(+)
MHKPLRSLFFLVALFFFAKAMKPLPVVLWHGMGDSCCSPYSMGMIQSLIQKHLPGVYVRSLMIGADPESDSWNSFFMNVNDQIEHACHQIANDSRLKDGFNAIGFSQGGQFFRGYIERCNNPRVHNLITLGAQHQGVFGFPMCLGANSTLCELIRRLLAEGPYIGFIQRHLAQAEYWKDPFNIPDYLKYCVFLPDINNERPHKNATYRDHMLQLNQFVMVKFEHDRMVQPRESEWFGFYQPGQDVRVLKLQETPQYQEDWLGLRTLDETHRLAFLSVPGDHLQFSHEWFIETIIKQYLV